MSKLKTLIALAVAMPFAALAANLPAGPAVAPAGIVADNAGSEYDCCWIFYGGRYYCVPC